MISDRDGIRTNRIPGRLKAIVLNGSVSVAYAGLANQSRDAVLNAKNILSDTGDLSAAIESLRLVTAEFDGLVEFAVASHFPRADLRKVARGKISGKLEGCYLGDSDAVGLLEASIKEQFRRYGQQDPDPERILTGAFKTMFLEVGIQLSDVVGGIPMSLLASPYGHCYNNYAGAARWDKIHFGADGSVSQDPLEQGAHMQWGYNVQPSKLRGVAVVGAYIVEANIGYIYSPIEFDEAQKVVFPLGFSRSQQVKDSLAELSELVEARAASVGGGFLND